MKVDFGNLKRQHQRIENELNQVVKDCIDNTSFIGGAYVKNFEKDFASFLDLSNCVACANGTDSIEILLKSFNIGPNDEVIVPAHSWISTSEAVSSNGAKPVFVDTLPDRYTIDATKIEEKITSKTKAIIPVHIYGHPAEMDEIMSIAKKHNLIVIEDCAQAHGALYKGKKIGTIGDAASFSFYPGKNLGAFGDAGCMVTNNDKIAETARRIANHGQAKKHDHKIEGRNSRMDTINAAVLGVKLKQLDATNTSRIESAAIYTDLLSGTNVILPQVSENAKHVFHLYVIQTENRPALIEAFNKEEIGYGIHYPTTLPLLEAYKASNYSASDFPVATAYTENIISLPMFPYMKREEIEHVCNVIKSI
ncbi:MAG: DegT/DnrJ/EryC1/StrS family aminotransferase [Flavobacteriales bacterium]|nr:DegT/DnrJ/EryC1/StrS family aminotransferase [Flavobacteriales bacterium]